MLVHAAYLHLCPPPFNLPIYDHDQSVALWYFDNYDSSGSYCEPNVRVRNDEHQRDPKILYAVVNPHRLREDFKALEQPVGIWNRTLPWIDEIHDSNENRMDTLKPPLCSKQKSTCQGIRQHVLFYDLLSLLFMVSTFHLVQSRTEPGPHPHPKATAYYFDTNWKALRQLKYYDPTMSTKHLLDHDQYH